MALLFTLIFGLFPALILSNFTGAQSKGRDTTRKSDINSIYQKLEEHYNENGYYPTAEAVQNNGFATFPGIDSEALVDDDGKTINEPGAEYSYAPYDCDNVGCSKYTLKTELESGEVYQKTSLN